MLAGIISQRSFFYATVRKKELKTRCNFEIVTVRQTALFWFHIANLKKKTEYMVRLNRKLATLICTCQYGTQEISTEIIDELHRCKHIVAVREFLTNKAKEEVKE